MGSALWRGKRPCRVWCFSSADSVFVVSRSLVLGSCSSSRRFCDRRVRPWSPTGAHGRSLLTRAGRSSGPVLSAVGGTCVDDTRACLGDRWAGAPVRGRNPRPGVVVPAPHRRFFARIGGVHHPALVQGGRGRPLVRSRISALPGRAWTAPPEASRRRRGRPSGRRLRPWEAIGSGGEWRRMESPHPPGEAGRVRTVDVPRVRRVRR